MEITKKEAEHLVSLGVAKLIGNIRSDGWLWAAYDRYDTWSVDHVRLTRI